LVIIPTYNEAESVPNLLRELTLLRADFNYLVVDDASPDRTADICEKLKTEIPNLEILRRSKKSGLGSAYRDGYRYALEKKFDAVIQIDADGSHQVSDLPKLLYRFESVPSPDLVIGSRWIKDGSVRNWSKKRKALSRLANIYSNLLLGLRVKDSTAGFRIYKTSAIKNLSISAIKSEGYGFQIEMTRKFRSLDARIIEVPIVFIERRFGKSKFSFPIVFEALISVCVWAISDFSKKFRS